MSKIKRHVGRLANTDRRCVIVMMRIPGRDDHALVIDTDALPARMHDALMQVIDSHEGQSTLHLHTILSRRVFSDSGVDLMNSLHRSGQLQAVPIDNVTMYPLPHSPCSLRAIIEGMGETLPPAPLKENIENRYIENKKADMQETQIALAQSLLAQAQDLSNAANQKREEAFRIAPTLRPNAFLQETLPVIQEALPVVPEHIADPDLPPDVAEAYRLALKEAVDANLVIDGEVEEPAHAVDTSDESVAAFLDRVASREDKANKTAIEAALPKRPVGRPRKDGLPAGTVKAD